MANISIIKRRIQAAQNVSKTTKAMQMIAASKLRRAQEAALSMKPYVENLTMLAQSLSTKIEEESLHPYMKYQKDINKTLLIVLSPDKGLCGGLITNLMREFFQYRNLDKNIEYITVGKKIEPKVITLNNEIIASFPFGTTLPTFDMVYPIFHLIEEHYLNKTVNKVVIISTRFSSVFTQIPKATTLLPIILPGNTDLKLESLYLFEPTVDEMLPTILKHYLEMNLYQHLLENYLSEQASRMIAMQNATDNAKDIIEELRLDYNKSRQAKITSEILDISGAINSLVNYE